MPKTKVWVYKNCGHYASAHMYPKITGKPCAASNCKCKKYQPKRQVSKLAVKA